MTTLNRDQLAAECTDFNFSIAAIRMAHQAPAAFIPDNMI